MKKLVIAYYAPLRGDRYMLIIREHFRTFITTGLYNACDKLFIGINKFQDMKPTHGEKWIRDFFKFSSSKEEGVLKKVDIVVYEGENGMEDIKEWGREYHKNNPDSLILLFSSVDGLEDYLNCIIL